MIEEIIQTIKNHPIEISLGATTGALALGLGLTLRSMLKYPLGAPMRKKRIEELNLNPQDMDYLKQLATELNISVRELAGRAQQVYSLCQRDSMIKGDVWNGLVSMLRSSPKNEEISQENISIPTEGESKQEILKNALTCYSELFRRDKEGWQVVTRDEDTGRLDEILYLKPYFTPKYKKLKRAQPALSR